MFLACLFVVILLAVGNALRNRFGIFEKIYVPASVIAGTIGLVVIQAVSWVSLPPVAETEVRAAREMLAQWPVFLIAVVFAAMLLQRHVGRRRVGMRSTIGEALMVWIIALGQTAVGLLLTWLLIQPFYDVPNAFGMLIETGFAGGHGTATAMGQIFVTPQIDFPVGRDLGLLMATLGLVYGTVSGIFWINVAVRLRLATIKDEAHVSRGAGWESPSQRDQPAADSPGPDSATRPSVSAKSVLQRYAIQFVAIAAAFLIGYWVQSAVGAIALAIDPPGRSAETGQVDSVQPHEESHREESPGEESPVRQRLRMAKLVGSFPLFIYTLFGGWVIVTLLKGCDRTRWLDSQAGARTSGWAMDLLVVAALATLNLQAVAAYLIPIAILLIGGAIWCAICLLVLSPRILDRAHWFELALINYGMSTGTTATGFVLLRLVDPQLKTDAAKQYALAAPLSAPMVGGGLITIGLPLLVLHRIPIGVSAVSLCVIVATLIAGAIGLAKRNRAGR